MDFRYLLYEKKDNICWITLNRPDQLNAIDDTILAELDKAFAAAEPDLEIKVVVIKGSGEAFSVGQDLASEEIKEVILPPTGISVPYKSLLETARRQTRRLEYLFNLAKPTIAQVHGYCTGLGFYLALACDLTIASEDSLFGDPALRMGILPQMPLPLWLVGIKRAKELFFSGRYITAQEAEEWGLINKVVPQARLAQEVTNLAEGISLLHSDALAITKDSLNAAMESRGLGGAWRFTESMSAAMQRRHTSTEEFDFFKVKEQKGFKQALEQRDAPYKKLNF
jgi:enoyl-CoA hydratase/carnithine racemase